MRFEQPLRVTEPRELRLRSVAGEILLESRAEGAVEWTLHLAARPAAAGPAPTAVVPVSGKSFAADALYRAIEAAGFSYGAEARRLVAVTVGPDIATGTLAAGSTLADPGVIEAAAQLLYAVVPDAEHRPPMLAGCAALERAGRDLPAARVWLRLREREPSGTIVADLGVLGPDGRPIAWLDAARFGRRRGFLERFGHEVRWERIAAPLATAAPTIVLDGPGLTWPCAASPAEACASAAGCGRSAAPHRLRDGGAAGRRRQVGRDDPRPGWAALPHPPRDQRWRGHRPRRRMAGPGRCGRMVGAGPGVDRRAAGAPVPDRRSRPDPADPCATGGIGAGVRCRRRAGGGMAAWATLCPPPAAHEPDRKARPAAARCCALRACRQRSTGSRWSRIAVVPAGHVLIEVVAAGLNFRDRLVALGLRPAETPLGADLAGIVRRIGDGVAGLQRRGCGRGPGRAGPRRPRTGPGRARSAGTDGRSGRSRQHAGRLCHRPGRPGTAATRCFRSGAPGCRSDGPRGTRDRACSRCRGLRHRQRRQAGLSRGLGYRAHCRQPGARELAGVGAGRRRVRCLRPDLGGRSAGGPGGRSDRGGRCRLRPGCAACRGSRRLPGPAGDVPTPARPRGRPRRAGGRDRLRRRGDRSDGGGAARTATRADRAAGRLPRHRCCRRARPADRPLARRPRCGAGADGRCRAGGAAAAGRGRDGR